MVLHLTRGNSSMRIPLPLPTTPGEVGGVYAALDEISTEAPTIIDSVDCTKVPNLHRYIRSANLDDLDKLNWLAERIDGMTNRERWIFSGALDANNINSLDDVLLVMDSLGEYTLIPNVNTDTELGRYVAAAGRINGDPRFPEASWDYLDFTKIGSEFYAERGGAYTYGGYVLQKSSASPKMGVGKDFVVMTLTLATSKTVCDLRLPAAEEDLEFAKSLLGIDSFTEAKISKAEFSESYLASYIPTECICVEDANELAVGIEEFKQRDGKLLKFLSVLDVMQPETMSDALRYAMELDDYERITDNAYEYGQTVLRRHGADDELLEAMEGYMDFEKLGEDAMKEDGVRRTEFGLIRRCSHPFPEESQSLQMGGM